jgi:hypothetical protein
MTTFIVYIIIGTKSGVLDVLHLLEIAGFTLEGTLGEEVAL